MNQVEFSSVFSIFHYLQWNNLSLDFIKLGFLKSKGGQVLRP